MYGCCHYHFKTSFEPGTSVSASKDLNRRTSAPEVARQMQQAPKELPRLPRPDG